MSVFVKSISAKLELESRLPYHIVSSLFQFYIYIIFRLLLNIFFLQLYRVDTTIKNDLGLKAVDIATQFKSKASLNILRSQKRLTSVKYPTINYFSHVPLNRRADKRKDSAWLESMKKSPKSKYVLFSNLRPLAIKLEGEKKYHLSAMKYPQIEKILGDESGHLRNVIFLGIEDFIENNSECSQAFKADDYEKSCAWFAVDVGHIPLASEKFLEACPGTEYLSPRPGFLQVHVEDATILAQARPILEWHQFNKFCPRCGSAVSMDDGGYKQMCTNGECSSNKGRVYIDFFQQLLYIFVSHPLATIHILNYSITILQLPLDYVLYISA